jgi:hypothetical protein
MLFCLQHLLGEEGAESSQAASKGRPSRFRKATLEQQGDSGPRRMVRQESLRRRSLPNPQLGPSSPPERKPWQQWTIQILRWTGPRWHQLPVTLRFIS